jgi:hypothetical protein
MNGPTLLTTSSLLALSAIAIRDAYHIAVVPTVKPAKPDGELQSVFSEVWLEVVGAVFEVNAWEKVSVDVEKDGVLFRVRLFPLPSYRKERTETRILVAARALDRTGSQMRLLAAS